MVKGNGAKGDARIERAPFRLAKSEVCLPFTGQTFAFDNIDLQWGQASLSAKVQQAITGGYPGSTTELIPLVGGRGRSLPLLERKGRLRRFALLPLSF